MVECKKRYTMREFYQWAEYETIEPFGDSWGIQQVAVLCASALNYGRKKGGRAFKPSDFLPKRRPKKTLSDYEVYRLKKFFGDA